MTQGSARAVVFDMDGVLVDSGAHHRDAWRAMFRDVGVTPPPEFWRLTIGRPADEAVALLLGGLDRAEARRLAEVKRQHYASLARRGTMAVAGVAAFLDILAARGVPRAVATSATRGDLEKALAWLEPAYAQRSPGMVFLKVEPKWNNLRSEPRFQDLLRRVGLP